MTLSDFETYLSQIESLEFYQPDGKLVPAHFHITEVGFLTKKYVDCGGTLREETYVSCQLWVANDYEHRLSPAKLAKIIATYKQTLAQDASPADGEPAVEFEYQTDTLGRYDVAFRQNAFWLLPKQADCLAKDRCGVPAQKPKVRLSELNQATCDPAMGCC
jgi:hypothetical protein